MAIVSVWIGSFILGFSDFLSALHLVGQQYIRNKGYNYCELVWHTMYLEEYTILAIAPICFIMMFIIYMKIYLKIRRHRTPGVSSVLEKRTGGGMQKNKKALITTLLNLGTFVVTWLPLCFFQVALLIKVHYNPEDVKSKMELYAEVDKYLFDLLMVNAIADSIIYAVRIQEVKLAFYRMFCCRGRASLALSRETSIISRYSLRMTRIRQSTSWGQSEMV